MQLRLQHLVFAALVISLVSLAYGLNYMYLSDSESTVFGDRIKFWHGDTLMGAVHSNGEIAIMQDPQFYAQVSSCARDFWHGTGYNPGFHGPLPIFNADSVRIPWRAEELRRGAAMQGGFFTGAGNSYRVVLDGGTAHIFTWHTGTPFDSTNHEQRPLAGRMCMFFDGPLELKSGPAGFTGRLSIGSSHDILLLDNVYYSDANHTNGVTPANSYNVLALVSEGSIKIANTPANGREDSHNRGLQQTNPDSSSIVVTAALYALGGSITFEQQNDIDSGYVYEYPPGTPHRDDRGTFYLYGAMIQRRRGYVHRSTPAGGTPTASTGYLNHFAWDPRLQFLSPPCGFEFDSPHAQSTDTINFGNVPVGQTVWDTAHVYPGGNCNLGSVIANYPFYATRVPPYYGNVFHIPARFTPPHTGFFSGILYISTPYHYFQIVLKGRGMPGGEPPHVEIAPNPFNLSTTIRYQLSEASAVKITLFDILGRTVKVLELGNQESGEHSTQLNAADLASGVYFVNLQTNGHTLTKKVLLLK